MLNAAAYLERISHRGSTDPTRETLLTTHRNHLFAVPFENLDIPLGRRIVCEEDSFLYKIVELKRGGFCYELNGAFAALLRGLGFRVTYLSAHVPREDGSESPEFDHLTPRVDLDEPRLNDPWLVDVGFGDSFLDPLRLKVGEEQKQDGRTYRIAEHNDSLHVERAESDGSWKTEYSFTLVPRRLEDFRAMCDFHQTSPESPFTRKSVCTKATPEGRITLSERKLIFTRKNGREERLLGSEEERRAVLQEYFGVVL